VEVEDVRRVAESIGMGTFNRRMRDHESVDELMKGYEKVGRD
jgi:hypothetical protein